MPFTFHPARNALNSATTAERPNECINEAYASTLGNNSDGLDCVIYLKLHVEDIKDSQVKELLDRDQDYNESVVYKPGSFPVICSG